MSEHLPSNSNYHLTASLCHQLAIVSKEVGSDNDFFDLEHCEIFTLDIPTLSIEMDEAFERISETNREATSPSTSLITPSTPLPKPPFSRANRHGFFTKRHVVLGRTEA